jgi:hypothetical protein
LPLIASFTAKIANEERDNCNYIRSTEDYELNAEWIFTLASLIHLLKDPWKENYVHDNDKYKK